MGGENPGVGQQPSLGAIGVSLLAWIALGVGICAWVLYYTGAFPEVVGLLGLGGLFAWIAFLANLLRKETKEDLQEWFEDHFLKPRRILLWIFAIAVVFFLGWAPFWGTLVVSTRRDDKDRTIEVRSRGEKGQWTEVDLAEQHFAPRSQRRFALFTPWFRSREYQVKISGLPPRIVRIQGWRREPPISVPSGFDLGKYPLVLIHLSEVLNASLHGSGKPGRLQVFRDGKSLGEIAPYFGEAVWVGGDEDIEIPARILTLWRLALVKDEVPEEALARWEPRRSIAPEAALAKGQRLEIRFTNPYGRLLVTPVIVAPPPYPQEVHIDEPHP